LSQIQRATCAKFGASYVAVDERLKLGITKAFDPTQYPINGLHHPPERDTTGWYIWSGQKFLEDPDFWVPLHVFHLHDRGLEFMKYLGLGPGWRFLIAPGYEDVWFDSKLLDI